MIDLKNRRVLDGFCVNRSKTRCTILQPASSSLRHFDDNGIRIIVEFAVHKEASCVTRIGRNWSWNLSTKSFPESQLSFSELHTQKNRHQCQNIGNNATDSRYAHNYISTRLHNSSIAKQDNTFILMCYVATNKESICLNMSRNKIIVLMNFIWSLGPPTEPPAQRNWYNFFSFSYFILLFVYLLFSGLLFALSSLGV